MSIEFKLRKIGRGKKSRLYKKIKRASLNRIDASHLPMRIHSSKDDYWNQANSYPVYLPYKKIDKFLMKRVGKPVDVVFSEFLSEVKNFKQKENLKELFYSHITYEKNKMMFGRGEGFYISNGILNYKNDYRKRHKVPEKFIEYNLSHFNRELLNFKNESIGPAAIGRFWVCANGQYMFLPVYVVGEEKWNRSRGNVDSKKFLYKACDKSELFYLKDFVKATVCGLGNYYSSIPEYYMYPNYYLYVVKIFDIESYKKEKFTKKV